MISAVQQKPPPIGRFGVIRHDTDYIEVEDQGCGIRRQQFTVLKLPFTFELRSNGPVVRVTALIRRPMTTLEPDVIGTYSWRPLIEPTDRLPGDTLDIPIVYIGRDYNTNYFGDFAKKPRPPSGQQYFFNAEVICGDSIVAKRIYLNIPINKHSLPSDDNAYVGNQFFLIEEDNIPFNDGRFDLALNGVLRPSRGTSGLGYNTGPRGGD